jgi:hypothetical protein
MMTARSLDAVVAGIDGGGYEVRESHVGDEASALLHLQHGLLPSSHSAMRSLPFNMPVSTPT